MSGRIESLQAEGVQALIAAQTGNEVRVSVYASHVPRDGQVSDTHLVDAAVSSVMDQVPLDSRTDRALLRQVAEASAHLAIASLVTSPGFCIRTGDFHHPTTVVDVELPDTQRLSATVKEQGSDEQRS